MMQNQQITSGNPVHINLNLNPEENHRPLTATTD